MRDTGPNVRSDGLAGELKNALHLQLITVVSQLPSILSESAGNLNQIFCLG